LFRSRAASLWAFGDLTWRETRQDRPAGLLRRDRSTTLTLGFRGNARLLGGRLYSGASVTQGLDWLGATNGSDPLASRADANSDFTKGNFWAEYVRRIGGPFSARIAMTGQWAANPVIAGEEFGIGGAEIGRGYDYFERSGDRGVSGIVELRANLPKRLPGWMTSLQFYSFVDGGVTDDIGIANDRRSLYSAGGGIRGVVAKDLSFNLEAAAPIDETRFDSGDKSPRLSVSVTSSF
jgi:hemolysin activation/secretion protein